MKPIIIQGATNSEIDYLLSKLNSKEKLIIGNFEFFRGFFETTEIIISRTKVGEINSAISTTIGILNFSPKYIINQGTAGAHSKLIHKGEFIVGEKYLQINSFFINFLDEGSGFSTNNWLIQDYDELNNFQYADKHLIKLSKEFLPKLSKDKVHFGIIGSGDIWNKECDRILFLNKNYNTLCEEMEIAGVYKTANNFNVPVIGIRIISNNELLKEEYDPEIAIECQKLVYDFVKELK